MTLRQWMMANRHSVIWLSKQVKVSRTAVYGWLDGSRTPRWKHIARLERLSGGLLTVATFQPQIAEDDLNG